MADGDAGGQLARRVGIRRIRDQHGLPDPFGLELMRDLLRCQLPVDGLTTRHRDGVVIQHLVGQVHAGGDALPDGEQAGVKVGAVAQIDELMRLVGEMRHPLPLRALAAHLAEPRIVAIHPRHHEMAPDPRPHA